ncbi:MAG: hypothetical protein ACOZBH_02425 [Patescibacteria group bacterium]
MKNFKPFPKRYYTEYGIYFNTANVDGRFPFFKEEIFCELMIEELKLVKEIYQCKIFGFLINYDHNHFLIQHADVGERNISKVMKSLKRNFSQNSNKIMGFTPLLPIGETTHTFQVKMNTPPITSDVPLVTPNSNSALPVGEPADSNSALPVGEPADGQEERSAGNQERSCSPLPD